ncbi:uncharacterized protein LOC127284412 [Leptopilina boulardi]|uniref:uncharacterized protein LOC127284412 n=1 Tax=Leptopilina boulardi TaxID=63433 RepID=UPI0021F5A9DB|nr:uncharacterized protein LOC127284412 [Leptopilina boulardi]
MLTEEDTESAAFNTNDMSKQENLILKKQLEDDWQELMDENSEASTSAPSISTSGRECGEFVPEVNNEEWSSDIGYRNFEMGKNFSARESCPDEDVNSFLR